MKVLTIRLDDDTHARAAAAAERDSRSLNGQLNWLIKEALDDRDDARQADAAMKEPGKPISLDEMEAGYRRMAAERRSEPQRRTVGYSKERQTGKGKR